MNINDDLQVYVKMLKNPLSSFSYIFREFSLYAHMLYIIQICLLQSTQLSLHPK